jgi:alkaline phosphatase D
MMDRRQFIAMAMAFGAGAAWSRDKSAASRQRFKERRDLYSEGVASGDPDEHSVLLWTRRSFADGRSRAMLTVEVAEDEGFQHVVAEATAEVSAASDWTCRVLVGGLRSARVYWYRFSDAEGFGSRLGRTITAPARDDPRPVRFAFVSCQNANDGAQNAYRRMIFDDERARPQDQLGFVFHMGDFIYEIVWYPEERPQGMYGRHFRELVRYPTGEKIADFHIPADLADYRAVYRAYLKDPDLQDARARWPFVAMWDNHEFSWRGWQGLQQFNGESRPAQTRKVAANQAWFEYLPARVHKPSGPSLERFDPPAVTDSAITHFDHDGLGLEPNNLAAINSLTGYRRIAWGPHVDLIITDQHSYRSRDALASPEMQTFTRKAFLDLVPEEVLKILDAGRDYAGGKPPASIHYDAADIANFRKDEPPQTILGAEQKAWFLERLRTSQATWKIWGNTQGTLDYRADPQNLPPGLTTPWPGNGYAVSSGSTPSDYGTAFSERAEIYDFVAREKISGFATICGDRHSFWAGYAAKELPPAPFEPVGVAFVTGSLSAPGLVEAYEHILPKDYPLLPLYLSNRDDKAKPEAVVNMLLRHGVRSCLEYSRSGDLAKARAFSNPDLAPHLSFVDMGGHGYAIVRAEAEAMDVEFVCIPPPLERSKDVDGGPLRYRVTHHVPLWNAAERPQMIIISHDGDLGLSV